MKQIHRKPIKIINNNKSR